jgi:plasmid maintenance system antidote protein VapI
MNPKNNLPPIYPGEFLKENLDELRISQAEFARTIGLSAMRNIPRRQKEKTCHC